MKIDVKNQCRIFLAMCLREASDLSCGMVFKDDFQKVAGYCNSFSKCVRKGAEIELSGTEAYIGLVLPLIKAVQHLFVSERPPKTAFSFDAHLVLPVAVLDSPMIAASIKAGATILTPVPWMRVLRHEYAEVTERFRSNTMWVIDVVHKDFFPTYLNQHVLPFVERFSQRVLKHPDELATGLGFVSGMGKDDSEEIEGRLEPRPISAHESRTNHFSRNWSGW
jgi:hypothetical protein